ncbi:response regulator of the LytR/AlgR family [Halobacteroides halobius DSM 5150]|uniref:Stage 0 sporulation protein A homolog n=1 Tax=Halobacteroides halobius (strain ATCC 35273 / DSM 5150 / MD-1) TaxID=748449 RepID=L0KAG4_HALHC|nr:LytTR family DNA-binding domain-containing protein [Halobacteroides halobius]AGB41344.1 response regulator of the LytR/AlgR family [Halobacteroides halobius DSM 5150]
MNRLKTVIVEDELPARNELSFLLEEIDDVKLIGSAKDGLEILEIIKEKEPDLVFLDIQLPGKTGLEVAQEIKKLEKKTIIVFLTAYDEYALQAFEVEAIDYILKPYEQDRLVETIKRVKDYYFSNQQQLLENKIEALFNKLPQDDNEIAKIKKLPVKGKRSRIKLIPYTELIVFHTRNCKVYVKTYKQEYEVDFTLKDLEEKLPTTQFLRVHRSFLINLKHVKEVIPWFKGKYQVVMDNQGEIKVPVSRAKVEKIKSIFNL